MKKKLHRLITLLLVISLVVGLTAGLTAGANSETMDMDMDGDGEITIHDVQLAEEIKSGQRNATDTQSTVLAKYSVDKIFNMIFGVRYVPPMDDDGVYKLTNSEKDLRFLRQSASEGHSFKLMEDIDLNGADWTPIDDFNGTFDGNGKTISNFKITRGAKGSDNPSVQEMGFFSEIMDGATVKDLNLRDEEIIIPVNNPHVQFVGLLCGTNRGTVTGCYTHGKITDNRTAVTLAAGEVEHVILAALIGRNVGSGNYSTVSNVDATEPTYNNGTRYTLKTPNSNVNDDPIPIAAQLAVEVANRNDIMICLSYDAPKSGVRQFQDITSTWGVSKTMQAKQDRVVDYMVAMGQVAWTSATNQTYIDEKGNEVNYSNLVWIKDSHTEVDGTEVVDDQKTWVAGTVYYGLPFNDYHNGLERFQSVATLNENYDENHKNVWVVDANKAYEVQTGQTTARAWYTSEYYSATTIKVDDNGKPVTDEDGNVIYEGLDKEDGSIIPETDIGSDGWIRYIGNDCSSACNWAWMQVSPVDAYSDLHKGGTFDEGGVFLDTCRHSFPYEKLDELKKGNEHYGHAHNIQQIGYYDFFETDDETGKTTKEFLTATKAESEDSDGNGVVYAALDGKYATTSADIWDWNADNAADARGADENVVYAKMYEAYTQARKGDVMQCWFTGDHAKNTINEDANNNGRLDEYHEDADADGKLDEGEDLNGNGKLDVTEDKNKDGKLNVPDEDTNKNGKLDRGEDLDGDGELDEGEDLNGNGKLDKDEDLNGNGMLDTHEDKNNDGKRDPDEFDYNENGILDVVVPSRIWEGHMRLLAENPVAIRNRDGKLDLKKSYMITCEHGGSVTARRTTRNVGVTDGTDNSWGLWQKYTFADLGYTAGDYDGDGEGECSTANGHNSSRCYMPITCEALRNETIQPQKYSFTTHKANEDYEEVTAPYAGEVYTNYALANVTMFIYDTSDQLVIDPVTIAALPEGGARSTTGTYRWKNHRQKQLDLTEQFAFIKDSLDQEGLPSGQYYFKLELESVLDVYNETTGKWENSKLTTDPFYFNYTKQSIPQVIP